VKESKISCIIPTLNRGQVLCDTIQMLLEQSHPAHEIVVVDQTAVLDKETGRMLEQWGQSGRIRWIKQLEPNASKARNSGALAATGDVLLFLDDDIRVQPDFLNAYATAFARTNAVGISGPILEGDAATVDLLPEKALNTELGWLYFPKNYSKECKETGFMMAGNVAVRRDIFLKLGGMDENYRKGAYREESDFAMRFKRAGYRFYYDPQCSIYHLGAKMVQGGGARSWSKRGPFWQFHHYVGDWYFNLGYATLRTGPVLVFRSLRYFILNKPQLKKPWSMIMSFVGWIAALPVALAKRCEGARLVRGSRSFRK